MLGRAVRASGGERTSRAGDVAENPVTGERVVVRVGTEDPGGELLVAELFVRPGGAVAGEHVHPSIEEWFTVLEGRVGFRLDGRDSVALLGKRLHVPPRRRTTGGTPGRKRRGS
jgi:quercetin dioxygenase-like cupin family protein